MRWQHLMCVSALLVFVLSGMRRHAPSPFSILWYMKNGRSDNKRQAESPMPTLQTVGNEGASTQMFGRRIYETLPMQDYRQTKAEEQKGQYWNICKCKTQEGGLYFALDAGIDTTKNVYPYQNKFGEKKETMWIVTTALCTSLHFCVHIDMLNIHLK